MTLSLISSAAPYHSGVLFEVHGVRGSMQGITSPLSTVRFLDPNLVGHMFVVEMGESQTPLYARPR